MAKVIVKDGVHYRLRRGKWVAIPARWLGVIPTQQTLRKRQSRLTSKLARRLKDSGQYRYLEARAQPILGPDEMRDYLEESGR